MKKDGVVSGALILLAITLVAGLLLSVVYELTSEPIAKAEQEAKTKAYRQVFKGTSYGEIGDIESKLTAANEALSAGTYDTEKITYTRTTVEEALAVKDEKGQTQGYVLFVTSASGYNGTIRLAFGFFTDGTVCGMRVLEHSETAGFGALCETSEYTETFVGDRSVSDVDAITGATYTSDAIKEASGAAWCFVNNYLREGGTAA